MLLICSLIQQIFVECLLCDRHCSRSLGYITKQHMKIPNSCGAHFQAEEGWIKTIYVISTCEEGNCCCSVAQSCPTLWDPMNCSQVTLSFTISWSLLKLMSIELMVPFNHLILYRPLLALPAFFPGIRVFWRGKSLGEKYSSIRSQEW